MHHTYISGYVFMIRTPLLRKGYLYFTESQVAWSLEEYLAHLGGLHGERSSSCYADGGPLVGACILLKARIHVYHGGQLGTSDTT